MRERERRGWRVIGPQWLVLAVRNALGIPPFFLSKTVRTTFKTKTPKLNKNTNHRKKTPKLKHKEEHSSFSLYFLPTQKTDTLHTKPSKRRKVNS